MIKEAVWGISVRQAAEELGVSEQTIRRMFNREPGHPGGWITGERRFNPDLGREVRRIDPRSVAEEKTRKAQRARLAAQPPADRQDQTLKDPITE